MMYLYYVQRLELELTVMALGLPTEVYAEHTGYVAPSTVMLTMEEIEALLDDNQPPAFPELDMI